MRRVETKRDFSSAVIWPQKVADPPLIDNIELKEVAPTWRCFSEGNWLVCCRYVSVLILACLLIPRVVGGAAPDILPVGGVNLGDYNYWDRGVPFVDFAKMGAEWLSSDGNVWSDDRSLPLTTSGYPAVLADNQIARSLMFTHNGGFYETGNYRVSWEGSGEVRLSSNLSSANPISIDAQEARYKVSSTSPVGLLLEIRETDPADPVRNVRVVPEPYLDQAHPFHPSYLRDLQNYGVLRFMDWGPTNGNAIKQWSDRSQPTDAHWGGFHGVPYEMQIALGNVTQQDIWLNIPHAASDDYVTQLARLVNEQLDPQLRVWIEYTNEAWNPLFSQNDYVRDVLRERYATTRAGEAYAMRAGEVFERFANEIAPERLVRVVGGWAQTPFMLQTELPALSRGQDQIQADVAAVAAYFGLDNAQMDQLYADYRASRVDLDRVFAELRADIDAAAPNWQNNREIAAAYGLPLVAYEAGQHLTPSGAGQRNDEGFVELLLEIQRDPRMGDLYAYLFQKWREIGGATITLFNNVDSWGRSGTWGLKEGFDDPVAPKFDAVQAYLTRQPGGWDLRTGTWLGDLDGNGRLDVADIDRLTAALAEGNADLTLDLNRDGQVNLDDHSYWVETLRQTYAGDANLDGSFTTKDLTQAFQRGLYEDGVPANAGWADGDWNGDQEFDTGDLVAVFQSGRGFGVVSATVWTVPEPAGDTMLALAALGLVAWCFPRWRGGLGTIP
jgi:hypothetical protein